MTKRRVVVTGMGMLSPLANTVEETWDAILKGQSGIGPITHFDPEQLAVQGNGFVSGVEDMSYATTRSIGIKAGLNF